MPQISVGQAFLPAFFLLATLASAAEVKVEVFSDFQCPYCAQFAKPIRELQTKGLAKVEFKNFQPIRHSLDLYNENQTDKLIKNIAERFTLSTTYIHKAIGNLINTVEDYRLQQIDSNKLKSITGKPTLSKEAEAEAINFLKQQQLLQLTNDCIGKSGVIGEEQNRLIMYLVFTSRKMPRPLLGWLKSY